VPSAVYYPIPLHKQPGYEMYRSGGLDLAVSEAKAKTVISLPFSPYLTAETQDEIVAAVLSFNG